MVDLPVWIAAILAIVYVLATLLSGIGAIQAGRNARKTEEIRVIVNGRVDERVEEAYRRGLAEGKLEAAARTPVVVVDHPHIEPSASSDNIL